jgi:hypothetical protein
MFELHLGGEANLVPLAVDLQLDPAIDRVEQRAQDHHPDRPLILGRYRRALGRQLKDQLGAADQRQILDRLLEGDHRQAIARQPHPAGPVLPARAIGVAHLLQTRPHCVVPAKAIGWEEVIIDQPRAKDAQRIAIALDRVGGLVAAKGRLRAQGTQRLGEGL